MCPSGQTSVHPVSSARAAKGCSFAMQENLKMTAETRIHELRAELDQHNYRYYVLDEPACRMPNTTACSTS